MGVLALLGPTLATPAAATPPTPDGIPPSSSPSGGGADRTPGKLLLVLDASGSMKGRDPSGLTKIAAAKKALTAVVDTLPADAVVGLRVYGATQPGGRPTPAACRDTQLVHPIGPLDRGALREAIDRFPARGETPIAYSLEQALADLGPVGKRNVVLVSDGEESCVADPCPSVKRLVGAGVDLQIDTVGFGADLTTERQLRCLAGAGRGTYYDAKDSRALTASLTKLSQRALRPFRVSGTPVAGTPDAAAAPSLRAGQYTDVVRLGAPPRHYRVTRPVGGALRVAVTARPVATTRDWNTEEMFVAVSTPSGTECVKERFYRLQLRARFNSVFTGTVFLPAAAPGEQNDPCAAATELDVAVTRTRGTVPEMPVEIVVLEEPAMAEVSALPAPGDRPAPPEAPAAGRGQIVVGGGSFTDAVTLTPGTYRDTVLLQEEVFYRVRLDYGQRAVFTADLPEPGATLDPRSSTYLAVSAFGPDRHPFIGGESPDANGSAGVYEPRLVLGRYTPTVTYRGRESGHGAEDGDFSAKEGAFASIAGYYYFSIGATASSAWDPSGPIPVRIRVAVEGGPTGRPTVATATSGSTAGSDPGARQGAGGDDLTAESGITSGLARAGLVVGPLAAVVGLCVGALVLARRRRRLAPAQPPEGSQT